MCSKNIWKKGRKEGDTEIYLSATDFIMNYMKKYYPTETFQAILDVALIKKEE
jgi:hypothetical protein